MFSFFSGLRGKLILTYTLVTVLALLVLEVLALLVVIGVSNMVRADVRSYLSDVVFTLYPQAREYLQPGARDVANLQTWLDQTAERGLASLPPQDYFDSPAAQIVPEDPILVLAPDYTVLAQYPKEPGDLTGQRFTAADDPGIEKILENALSGSSDSLAISMQTPEGNYRMAVPVRQDDRTSPVIGVILLTVRPIPSIPLLESSWPFFLGVVLATGVLLLIAVAPLGALFGLVMSRGLTSRLLALSRAADAWSEGNFRPLPVDRSNDEIGVLGKRLQAMAERIQNLLQSQQELAVLEERHRLARDLHDTVKQQSFATLMQVRATRNLIDTDQAAAKEHLTIAEGLLKSSQQELGLLIAELRPAALEGQGLVGALRSYLSSWSQHTRIPAELQVSNERRLPLQTEQTLYRVAQEALANVARHSRASAVRARITFSEQAAQLAIIDNGIGFLPESVTSGFGLNSMRERVQELGGELEVASLPEQGTRVTAQVPLK